MKRDPSLHIKRSDLFNILRRYMPKGTDLEAMTSIIMHDAKHLSVTNRSIVSSQDKIEKKTNKLKASSRNDADRLAKILTLLRRQMGHRGVTMIPPGHKDWLMIKGITGNANDFCNEFQLATGIGYTKYLRIGISKMTKYTLPKLVNMYESICNTYLAESELESDPTPEKTTLLYNYYRSKIAEKTGLVNSYTDNPEKYVFFYKAKLAAEKYGVNYRDYVDAQFALMEYRGGMPDPIQLVGDKATERLNKHMFKEGIRTI